MCGENNTKWHWKDCWKHPGIGHKSLSLSRQQTTRTSYLKCTQRKQKTEKLSPQNSLQASSGGHIVRCSVITLFLYKTRKHYPNFINVKHVIRAFLYLLERLRRFFLFFSRPPRLLWSQPIRFDFTGTFQASSTNIYAKSNRIRTYLIKRVVNCKVSKLFNKKWKVIFFPLLFYVFMSLIKKIMLL